jgi:hypothetical protein
VEAKWGQANFDTTHVIISGDFNHLEETDWRGKAGKQGNAWWWEEKRPLNITWCSNMD